MVFAGSEPVRGQDREDRLNALPDEPSGLGIGPGASPVGSSDRSHLTRLRLDLSYDGTEFSGWASQGGQRTVQETVQDALRILVHHPVSLTVAGRTDAGVHATGQVAHFDVRPATDRPAPPAMLARLNGLLPPDVRVRGLRVVPREFDARFSARSRWYRYRLDDSQCGPEPLRRRDTAVSRWHLAPELMSRAAVALLGEHDFAAYCRRRPGASTIRRLLELSVARDPADGVVVISVGADAFCHNMVRSLVGALCAVGAGRKPLVWPYEVLCSGVRHSAVNVASARGLTLVRVEYPPEHLWASRAEESRRFRGGGDHQAPVAPRR